MTMVFNGPSEWSRIAPYDVPGDYGFAADPAALDSRSPTAGEYTLHGAPGAAPRPGMASGSKRSHAHDPHAVAVRPIVVAARRTASRAHPGMPTVPDSRCA